MVEWLLKTVLPRRRKLADFYLKGLREGGMTVTGPSETLREEFKGFGNTMTQEWLKSVGDDGKAILEQFRKKDFRLLESIDTIGRARQNERYAPHLGA